MAEQVKLEQGLSAEEMTALAITEAARVAFKPAGGGRLLRPRDVVRTCAAVVTFLERARHTGLDWNVEQWQGAVERLTLSLKRPGE